MEVPRGSGASRVISCCQVMSREGEKIPQPTSSRPPFTINPALSHQDTSNLKMVMKEVIQADIVPLIRQEIHLGYDRLNKEMQELHQQALSQGDLNYQKLIDTFGRNARGQNASEGTLKAVQPELKAAQQAPVVQEKREASSPVGPSKGTGKPKTPLRISDPVAQIQDTDQLCIMDEKGHPMGEFTGRPNLLAYLQAKSWDSVNACHPGIKKKEPDVTMWIKYKQAIMSHRFDLGIGVLIMANSVVMGLKLEWEGTITADAIGIDRDEGEFPHAEMAFHVLENFFALCFLFELLLRLSVSGWTYFKTLLNWMDFTVVVTSILEMYIFNTINADGAPDLTLIKLLRTFRIIRILRIIRMLRLFKRLRTLVGAVASSVTSLGWSMILLGIVQLVGSIFITLALQPYLKDENEELMSDEDMNRKRQVYIFFGTFSRSCITLFEITFAAGTWGRVGRVVVFEVNRWYAVFFLGYMMFVSFAMIRVIAAIFLKETLSAAARDSEKLTAEINRAPEYVQRINAVFHMLDEAKEGFINLQELHKGLNDREIRKELTSLGIDCSEVEGLFILMDDGDCEITYPEFLTGCMRLGMQNQGVDLPTYLFENKKILQNVLAIERRLHKLQQFLGDTNIEQRIIIGNC
eukprot:gnl/MRDRNA2_/MRDRNA2_106982_c0_seq1.p1 gnl/MRDRNA2_/MRDRNA2_106982_c0~~gnl/MRDRNA2_/MRDRNA2_106982_c0_seq1.p1  ORF type:complete len:635 (+),score=91.48 gnl/MRDRNA2_/MRDRNA2_106982_c0_seq1:76-1980(+)